MPEWYSVYGHALAGTVLLVLLYQIAGYVRDGRTPRRGRLWTWFAIAIVGTTCFGVGLAVALVLPFVIVCVFPGRFRWWRPPLLSLGCAGETAWGISIGIASGVAVALLLAAGAVAVRDCRARPTLLACGLLTAAVYGIIATARGFFFLERPDLLHMATRHQYAALIPVTIAVCVALQSARRGVLPCRAACRPQSCCCGPSAR